MIFISLSAVAMHVCAEELADPTAPLAGGKVGLTKTSVAEADKLHLSAIFSHAGTRKAVVNNQTVAVGDQVAGQVVVAIDANSVTFAGDKAPSLVLLPSVLGNAQERAR